MVFALNYIAYRQRPRPLASAQLACVGSRIKSHDSCAVGSPDHSAAHDCAHGQAKAALELVACQKLPELSVRRSESSALLNAGLTWAPHTYAHARVCAKSAATSVATGREEGGQGDKKSRRPGKLGRVGSRGPSRSLPASPAMLAAVRSAPNLVFPF